MAERCKSSVRSQQHSSQLFGIVQGSCEQMVSHQLQCSSASCSLRDRSCEPCMVTSAALDPQNSRMLQLEGV